MNIGQFPDHIKRRRNQLLILAKEVLILYLYEWIENIYQGEPITKYISEGNELTEYFKTFGVPHDFWRNNRKEIMHDVIEEMKKHCTIRINEDKYGAYYTFTPK